jgi:hypothetical protein
VQICSGSAVAESLDNAGFNWAQQALEIAADMDLDDYLTPRVINIPGEEYLRRSTLPRLGVATGTGTDNGLVGRLQESRRNTDGGFGTAAAMERGERGDRGVVDAPPGYEISLSPPLWRVVGSGRS